MLQFVLIFRSHHDHIGHMAKIGVVEGPVVRRPVFGHQSCPINEDRHGQVLRGDIMDDLVVGSLQERGIHGHDRPGALSRQPRGEGERMLLGNPDVVKSLGKLLGKSRQSGPFAHRRRDGHDPAAFPRQPGQRVHGHRGIRRLTG